MPVIVLCSMLSDGTPIPNECVTVEDTKAVTETWTACSIAAGQFLNNQIVVERLKQVLEIEHGPQQDFRYFLTCQNPDNMDAFIEGLPKWVIIELQSYDPPLDT